MIQAGNTRHRTGLKTVTRDISLTSGAGTNDAIFSKRTMDQEDVRMNLQGLGAYWRRELEILLRYPLCNENVAAKD